MTTKLKQSKSMTIALVVIMVIASISFNFDITEFVERKELNIPTWYFFILFTVDMAFIASLIFIYFRKKIGTFLYPASIFSHFLFNNFYLNSFLYFDLFLLFIFFAVILLLVIPEWDQYN